MIHQHSPEKITAVLYDVSGHGVSAALTSNLVYTQLQQILADRSSPANVLDRLNQFIFSNIEKTYMFLTLVVVEIDLVSGAITASNAGHPDILIWRAESQTLERIPSHTTPVGMTPKILGESNETVLDVSTGDRVLLYTDGFVEARDRESQMLGMEGLMKMISRHASLHPVEFLDRMFDELNQYHANEPEDDLTFVVVEVK